MWPMKKKLAFLSIGLAVVLIVAFLALSRLAVPAPPISLAFAAFTNTSQRTEALFWFSNRAEADFTWNVTIDVSRWSPTGWVQEPPVISSDYGPGNVPSGRAFSDLDLLGFPVTNTNVPMRFTLNYHEKEKLSRRLQIGWTEFRENLGKGNKVEYSRERDGWVSGETVVAGGPPLFQ
jgi:hypothetical protein